MAPSARVLTLRRPRRVAPPLAVAALVSLCACGGSSGSAAAPSPARPAEATPEGRATSSATASAPDGASVAGTRIRVTVGGQAVEGVLYDNAPARDLASRLPLTLAFSDLSNQEKVGHLDRPLSMTGMPAGDDPAPGDIGWYAPWGNVVLYYGDVGHWDGIARIGRFDGGTEPIEAQTADFTATIERAG